MTYLRMNSQVFLVLFMIAAQSFSSTLADQNSPEKSNRTEMLNYVPDALRVDRLWQQRQERIAREHATLFVGEKPAVIQRGYYKHGRYVQCNLDMQGALASLVAGGGFRFLYSVATCGTEYKKFKQAAFTPGVAKSFLFWVPAVMAYQFIVHGKDHEAFVQKMNEQAGLYNPHNQFAQIKEE